MKNFNFDSGDWSWGKYGAGDYYHEPLEELKAALESGKPFDTGWHGFVKIGASMRVSRDEHGILVEAADAMDEVFGEPDLIMDCLTDEESEKLTDEMIAEIQRRLAACMEFYTEFDGSEDLPANATLEEVLAAGEKALMLCDRSLENSFSICIKYTLQALYGESDETNRKIASRIYQLID